MCGFARSKDRYRFTKGDMQQLLSRSRHRGVEVVRLTGGEPLVHREVVALVSTIRDFGMRPSLITNGHFLGEKAADLAEAGLEQVVVSLDGTERVHDELRGAPGLFARAVAGLHAARACGVQLRVNTVVGRANFRELVGLQQLLTELHVQQWEASALKLDNGRPLDFDAEARAEVAAVNRVIYETGPARGLLRPMGKRWSGDSPDERRLFFDEGVAPRPDGRCHVVEHVRYLDAKNGAVYPCSLLPHRPEAAEAGVPYDWRKASADIDGKAIRRVAAHFAGHGPEWCRGCSSSAAGYSQEIEAGTATDWSF
jgi:cytosylglucuronate decarboxylase